MRPVFVLFIATPKNCLLSSAALTALSSLWFAQYRQARHGFGANAPCVAYRRKNCYFGIFSSERRVSRCAGFYLRRVLPFLGRQLADDEESYRYLGESILRFPPPPTLKEMLNDAGFEHVRQFQFAAGAVVLHSAWRTK